MSADMKTIGILGFGNVGRKLGNLFSGAGYQVRIGLRDTAAKECSYPVGSIEETALGADALALARSPTRRAPESCRASQRLSPEKSSSTIQIR